MMAHIFKAIDQVVNFILGVGIGMILLALIFSQQPVVRRVLDAQGSAYEESFLVACEKSNHAAASSRVFCRVVGGDPKDQNED